MNWGAFAWKVIAWACGGFLIFAALRMPFGGIWIGAVFMLLAGLTCLPPVRALIAARSPIKGHPVITGVAVIAPVSVAASIGGGEQKAYTDRKEAADRAAIRERLAKQREQLEAEFQGNKRAILTSAQSKADAGQHAAARQELARFAQLRDPDFARLWATVSIATLREELGQSPTEDRQAAIYAEIARLDPSDTGAAGAAAVLKGKLEADRQATAARAQRESQIKAHFSKWDGSHPEVVARVKARMHNPSSFDHVATRYVDPGKGTFTVIMKYRGTNAFNAVVTNSVIAEVSLSGQVVTLKNN